MLEWQCPQLNNVFVSGKMEYDRSISGNPIINERANMNELYNKSATELARLIKSKEISAREVMQAHLEQIARVNPQVNAIVTLLDETVLLDQADQADAALSRSNEVGDQIGVLHGLPVAHKDLTDTKGIRTTYGSPLFADWVPQQNALLVERMQSAGAITIGKTNTPEFGAGSQTFNPVFGRTLNPYDLSKTCGGSSGGAAVALATRMIPIADGSDMGGSLRNPAAFCNVVGFRPSPGRVPSWPKPIAWSFMGVDGPMARTVQDIVLMLQAMAGPDPRAPIAIREPGSIFAAPLERDWAGAKIAWSENLGGIPVDAAITSTINQQRGAFESLGCDVIEAEPKFDGADRVFKTLRAHAFAAGFAPLLESNRDQLKETVIWNTEAGVALNGLDISNAEKQRTTIYHELCAFMDEYEYLVCPVTQVPPFDVNQEYITEINGQEMETYIDWMQSCYFITVTGFPAASVPCGFTADGLPVGVQIVGRHEDDFGVLQLAYAFEQATGFGQQIPTIARG